MKKKIALTKQTKWIKAKIKIKTNNKIVLANKWNPHHRNFDVK
jgi:hypothetical protein